jgi:hypothetical protein
MRGGRFGDLYRRFGDLYRRFGDLYGGWVAVADRERTTVELAAVEVGAG